MTSRGESAPETAPETARETAPEHVARRPWIPDVVVDVVAPLLVTRVALLVVGLLAVALLPDARGEGATSSWIGIWAHWDAGWYISIAQDGYAYDPDGQSNVVFFPMYPVLMKAVAVVLGLQGYEGFALAGIIVSNAALLVALLYLVRLVALDADRGTAARTAVYLLVFPTSLFLSAVYTEGLFLAFTVAAFYHARRDQWWLAGVLSIGAALTRPYGFLIAAPLLLEYLAMRGFAWRAVRADLIGAVLAPVGLAAFLAYLGWRFGDPFLLAGAQREGWGRTLAWPWDSLRTFIGETVPLHGFGGSWLDLAFAVTFGVLVLATWRFTRPSYALFATLFFLAPLSSGTLQSLMRYEVTIFPAFLLLARAGGHVLADRSYVVVACMLGALFMAMFALHYWVA